MFTLRTGLMATALTLTAMTTAMTATAAAAQASTSTGTSHPASSDFAPGTGLSVLHETINLPTDGAWTSTPLQVHLPAAGTYTIDANVRGRLQGTAPLDTWITARLWNVTTSTPVPDSERLIYQVIDTNPANQFGRGNQTASISELVRASRPETIELQAQNGDTGVPASIAQICSDGYGYTSMRYVWVGP
jgi:hypothetical protein